MFTSKRIVSKILDIFNYNFIVALFFCLTLLKLTGVKIFNLNSPLISYGVVFLFVIIAATFVKKLNHVIAVNVHKSAEFLLLIGLFFVTGCFFSTNLSQSFGLTVNFVFAFVLTVVGCLYVFSSRKKGVELIEMSDGNNKDRSITEYIFLLFVLTVYLAVRAPYLDLSFTGLHEMKYSTYVEPAKHMTEHGFLWNQAMYQSDPESLPEGKFDTFGQYPFMEWGITSLSKLNNGSSLEFNTRLFMTILGVAILILLNVVTKMFMQPRQRLVFIFLLSINPIFQFFTFVTVLDSINILFFLISIYFLIRGLEKQKLNLLFLSGVVAGIGVNVKYHALIFYTPLIIYLLFKFCNKNYTNLAVYLITVLPSLVLETVFFRSSLRYLPRDPIFFGSIFIIIVILHIILFYKIDSFKTKLETLVASRITMIYSTIIAASILILLSILTIKWVQSYLIEFVTDGHLILNINFYTYFFEKYISWVSLPILILAGLAVPFIFSVENKSKKYYIAFWLSAIVYFLITSKVLFFHEYYHHILVIVILMFATIFVNVPKMIAGRSKAFLYNILVTILLASTSLSYVTETINFLSQERPSIKLVANEISKILPKDKYFIYSSNVPTSVGYYSNRFSLFQNLTFDYNRNTETEIRNKIKQGYNFGDIMQSFGITVYITRTKPTEINDDFAYLYIKKTEVQKNISERTEIILCDVEDICHSKTTTGSESEIFTTQILPYLHLLNTIDGYYIYSIY